MAESPEQVPSEDGNSFLEDELEALRSIYVNETNVYEDDESTVVSIDLHPATADNLQEQYVKLTLKLTVKDGYPDVIPEIDIRNPRGLSDEILSSITNDLLKIAEDKRGNSMLFEIIEAAKDYLTAGNRPCEECAICLYGFHDDDIFTKTECYHYFHSHCLARYAKNSSMREDDSKSDDASKNELLCPVCRLPIHFDGDDSYPSPVKCDDEFSVTETMLQTQKKLQELYIKQVEKGGIIDLEAEKNKYLIEISHVPSVLDAASEEEMSVKMPDEKDKPQTTSPSENAQNSKLDSQKYSSLGSERSNRKFTKHNEDRRRNDVVRPHQGNDYRGERYQSNRGGNGYRRDPRGRNNYDRRYDGYNNERSDRYGGINSYRYSNPRRNNWHENQFKSNRYERRDKFDDRNNQQYEKHDKYEDRSSQQYEGQDRNSQKYERYDKYGDRNSQKYERHDKYDDRNIRRNERYDKNDDGNSQRYDNPRDQRKKQPDSEEGVSCKDSVEADRSCDIADNDDDDNVQDGLTAKVGDEKRHNRYDSERRNVNYGGGQRNNQYNDRRDNRYDRRNVRYDNNKRFGRYEDRRDGQYDRRNGRFDGRKYNEHNGSRRNENFASGRNDKTVDRDKYSNPENEINESKFSKENEIEAKNTTTIEKESENSSIVGDESLNVSECHTELNASSKISSKDEAVSVGAEEACGSQTKPSSYTSDRRHNFPNRNSGSGIQSESRNYNRHYQRSNSYGDRHSKQSNYHSERRQAKPQNFRRNSDNTDEGENSNPSKSNEVVVEGAGEPNESNLEENHEYNNEESGDFSDSQHSKKSSMRTDSGNVNHYRNYRGGRQGYNNRYQNNNPLKSNEAVAEGAGEPNESNLEENQEYNNEESGDFSGSQRSKMRTDSGNVNHYRNYRGGRQGYNNRYQNNNPLKSNEVFAEGAGEPNESNLEENQDCNNEESGDFSDSQRSKKSSMRTDSGNANHYKNYRGGKQGFNNRYQNNNKSYHETRPYRNNPHSRNNQSDYSDRTSNGSKRYAPQKYSDESGHNSLQTENDSDVKPKTISKENVESVPVETSKPTVRPKSSDLEKSVPTSNFLPPMSSVAPPPGFQNPSKKIVYGLAAANPPPGFNRS